MQHNQTVKNFPNQQQNLSTPPALNPAKPIPPTGAKPFPPPTNPNGTNLIKAEAKQFPDNPQHTLPSEDVKMDQGSQKSDLNKTKEGKIKKKLKQKWSKQEKKSFINIRLRRMISPKPPVQILEELIQQEHGEMSFNFLEPVMDGGMQLFTCEVSINGEVFSGTGPSKPIAKNIAAEGAIHAFITNSVQSAESGPETEDIADNAPWTALASLGLFKLFNDWQSQGYSLPQQFMSTPSPIQKNMAQFGTPNIQPDPNTPQGNFIQQPAKMPQDPTSKHPVMLLNELYPGVTFEGSLGLAAGNLFSMTVEVQGRSFQGTGRSKKDAKKACATAALKSLHDIEYDQA